MTNRWVRASDAAAALGVPYSTIRSWTTRGARGVLLPSRIVDGHLEIDRIVAATLTARRGEHDGRHNSHRRRGVSP